MLATRAKFKLKKGDNIVVIAGKDKGKTGEIISVDTKTRRVLVSGINVAKKHAKPSQLNPQGGILNKEMPIHISNVAMKDPKTDLPTRVGYKVLEDGTKVRIAKKSKETIESKKS